MNTTTGLSKDQKIAALVLPFLFFGVLGATTASAHMVQRANLSEEQRDALQEAKALHTSGDTEAAKEVLEEAGIKGLRGIKAHRAHHAGHETLRDAIETNDYEAFAAATAETPFAESVSEDMFNTLVEAHALRETGEYDAAHELLREAGLKGMRGHHHKVD